MIKRKPLRKLFAVFFALLTLFGAIPDMPQSETVRTAKASSSELYALEITTGSIGTDVSNLKAIKIYEKGYGKTEKTYQTIYGEDSDGGYDLNTTLKLAMNRGSAYQAEEADLDAWKTAYSKTFMPYKTQTIFFRAKYSIKSVEYISFVMQGSSSWEIQNVRLIEMKESSIGTYAQSAGATEQVPDFEGTCMLDLKGTINMQWKDEQTFTVRKEGSSYATMDAYITNINESYKVHDKSEDSYWLQIKVADEYMAGLESLDLSGEYATCIDLLAATFFYEDTLGDIHKVSVPIISGLEQQKKRNCSQSNINAYAQQGNNLVVQCYLPKFSKLITDTTNGNNGIKITLGYDKTGALCYKNNNAKQTDTSEVKERAKKLKDALSITDIALYDSSKVRVTTKADGGELGVTVSSRDGNSSAVPLCYYSYKKTSGREVAYGDTESFTLTDNTTDNKALGDKKTDTSNVYLVEVSTADVSNAQSGGELSMSIFYTTYGSSSASSDSTESSKGKSVESDSYSVKNKVTQFYGYWPSTGSTTENYAYYKGMSKGGKLRFLVTLDKVDTFTGVKLSLEDGKQWQASDIRISRVTGLKHRSITLDAEKTITYGDGKSATVSTNINREVTSVVLASSSQQVLIRSGKSKTIQFSETQSAVEDSDVPDAWDPTTQEMTYQEACSNLGFNESRVSYDIDVTVAGSSDSDATNGDSGSKNLFYFRLNFENGSSAYVLANQQISSDGFRTGQTERFSISMNQSYGDLVSVDIIPDDSSSNSDIYDKLNIAKIRVTRKGDSAVNRSWEVSSPGWVGVDYKEDGETATKNNNKGRYEGEIVRNYLIDKTSYNVKLLFAISTGEYETDDKQFSGTVQATLKYTDSSGENKTLTFDMIGKMYEYGNTSSTDMTGSRYNADTSTMFRANSVDRFYLDLADVQSVDGLDIKFTNADKTTLHIKQVGVSLVKSVGELYINNYNEYEYTGKSEDLTIPENLPTEGYEVKLAAGASNNLKVVFKQNTINIDKQDSTDKDATAVITRKPSGTNDTLNMFVKPELKSNTSLDSYDMRTEFYYTNAYGTQYNTGIASFENTDKMYYRIGYPASNFALLKQIKAIATAKNSKNYTMLYGDEIIIQHVRSGTMIGTYRVDTSDIELSATQSFSESEEITNKETQTVSLYFGGNTVKQALTDTGRNVAVSIGFKSSLGKNDTVYHSPYVYLTDEQYQILSHNMMAEVNFHIPYVKEITDIRVAGIDNAEGTIESAVVGTYKNDTSADLKKPDSSATAEEKAAYSEAVEKAKMSRTVTGWYSFNINAALKNGAQTFSPTNTDTSETGALIPATLTLTADDAGMSSNVDLAVKISYLSDDGETEVVRKISSVKDCMDDSSSFTAGKSVVVPLMLSDIDAITKISVQTVESGTTYPLSKVVMEWNRYGKINTVSQNVGKEIDSKGCDISLVTGSFSITATSYPQDGSEGMTLTNDSSTEINFALKQGDTLKVKAVYSTNVASDAETYTLYKKESSGAISNVEDVVSVNGKKVIIDTSDLEAGDYELHIVGELSKAEAVVKFTVKEQDKEKDKGQD